MRGPGQAGSLPRCESKIFTTENTEGTEKSGYNPLYELWLALGPVMTRAEQLESLSVESAATSLHASLKKLPAWCRWTPSGEP